MWKGSGRTFFQDLVLNNQKFILFLVTPVATASIFWNDRFVEAIVTNRQYVSYPPEGERPPSNREELAEALERQKAAASAAAKASNR